MKLEQIKANCSGDEQTTHRHTHRQDFASLLALVPTCFERVCVSKQYENVALCSRHEGTVNSCKCEVCVIVHGARTCPRELCAQERGDSCVLSFH